MEEKEMAYYLEDLNRIHELSLEKLGEWKERFPYSQIVHFLMAKKHQLEGFVDDMSIYHKASFYAVDRAFLQKRMTQSELEVGEAAHDPIDIEEASRVPEIKSDVKMSTDDVTQQKEELEPQRPHIAESEDLSDFAQWLVGLGGLKVSQGNIGLEKKKKKRKKKKKSKLERKIDSSVVKKEEIISEALANILAQQGHNEKAIDMYQKLSLIFPEKSSFFALQIEKLK